MRELRYEVEFISDIVLPATSNTEGKILPSDFIAGSNFLGMVASKYNEFKNSFQLFHSGAVKFGDATPLYEGKKSYKMPLTFFHEKLNDKNIFNHHLIEDFAQFDQLKQKRNGYITEDLDLLYVEHNYSQKSAYDKEHRRSKEGSMFGYSALQKGTKWLFSIKCADSVDADDIKLLEQTIKGEKRLGKSRSAQYGLVNIKPVASTQVPKQTTPKKYIYLYLNSRVALLDTVGNPTYDLTYLYDALKEENIVYEKCQLRTSSFTPYNRTRQTKDYERVCINSGSVIVLEGVNAEDIPSYVGAYQSEGFGEILINPSFLTAHNFTLEEKKENGTPLKSAITTPLATFLQKREDSKLEKLTILDEVDSFIQEHKKLYKKIKPSQWGKIRSICTSAQANFKAEIREYISHGAKEWETKQIETLLKDVYSLEFIKLISIQMPKQGAQND